MSFNELIQPYLSPWPSQRQLRRWIDTNRVVGQRRLRLALRTLRTATTRYYRQQYFLMDAYRDARRAVARNEDIVISTIFITFVLAFSLAATALDVMILFLGAAYEIAEATNTDMGLLVL